MKTLKYIALSLLAAACTTACKDDPELLTTDVGPEMTAVSSDASGVFGGKVGFEATMTDRYALSTLKAQIFFDDEMVAEEVIRTKENGTYSGTVTLPFYKNVPDGEATLRLVGQNVRFGQTFVERPLAASRPKPDHLVFVLGEQEYRMEPTGVDYEYAVTADFPQKPQGYITTPDLDGQGSVVTFGYSSEQGGIVSDSTEPIPFANSNAGEFTVTFNLKSFEGSPFIKLLFNDAEMTMVDNDNYSIVTTLTQNQTYTLTGVSDFAGWDVDRDFFERADASESRGFDLPADVGHVQGDGQFQAQLPAYRGHEVGHGAMRRSTRTVRAMPSGPSAACRYRQADVMKNAASWSPEQGGHVSGARRRQEIPADVRGGRFDRRFVRSTSSSSSQKDLGQGRVPGGDDHFDLRGPDHCQ